MTNLWILTEEHPKLSVVQTILQKYATDFNETVVFNEEFNIKPIIIDGKFTFEYIVEGVNVSNVTSVFIEIVSGNSSFVDYMLIRQNEKPTDHIR